MALSKIKASSVDLTDNYAFTGTITGAGGITEADLWRVTVDEGGDQSPLTNWERADSDSQGYIGTGMSHSSGTFTFPSTGIWLVNFIVTINNGSATDGLVALYIKATTNGSSYGNASVNYEHVQSGHYSSGSTSLLFDCTNTSTHKVQFHIENALVSTTIDGHSTQNETHATFVRLGDT